MWIRVIFGILIILALAFMADQEFADGRNTGVAQKAVAKAMKAIGIQ
jgi:hypothetical protein